MTKPKGPRTGPPERMLFKFADGSVEEIAVLEFEGQLARQLHELLSSENPAYRELGQRIAAEQARRRIERSNVRSGSNKANLEREAVAQAKARARWEAWCIDPRRSAVVKHLTATERLKKYLKVGRPTDRDRRRLNAMLKAGQIK